ncbi:DUF1294 domain-containing protein [Planococcaceae bacterium Storch 2/2-2]|nr:DUF1294 domain-containing protein [Planococcaceae bacterium Storch 2/2-2]
MNVALYLVGMTVLTFLLFGIDKRRARRNEWRIAERTLFLLSIGGGSIGALIGMHYFHHKTKKRVFRCGIPLISIMQLILGITYYER